MELREAYQLALNVLAECRDRYDLDPAIDFAFDRAQRRLGSFQPGRKRITVSRHAAKLNDRETVEEIIRHELAHALAYQHDGCLDHGAVWKKWAKKMGAEPRATCSSAEVTTPDAPFGLYCPKCGLTLPRYRKAKRKNLAGCPTCSGQGRDEFHVLVLLTRDELHLAREHRLDYGTTEGGRALLRQLRQPHFRKWRPAWL